MKFIYILLLLFCQGLSYKLPQHVTTMHKHPFPRIIQSKLNTHSLSSQYRSPSSLQTIENTNFERDRTSVTPRRITRYGPHLKIGGKILNSWGVFYAFTTLVTALTLFPLMLLFSGLCDISGNGKRRRALDWVIHAWARITMTLTTSKIKVYGVSNLPAHNETVVYIPNHTSYFDIPLLSGYIPRPFKYLSKAEIMRIPLVGFGMRLAKHVFLVRNDAKSVEEVGEMCVQRLRDGNSMLLFAEGTRSVDGKLHLFKKGAFQIAKSANVSIVPVSISNMHYWTPKDSLLPVAPIRFTYVKIHPPITTQDKSVRELKELCFQTVNSGLPIYQQYKKPNKSTITTATDAPTTQEVIDTIEQSNHTAGDQTNSTEANEEENNRNQIYVRKHDTF